MVKIGQVRAARLDSIAACLQVIRCLAAHVLHARAGSRCAPKYACRRCDNGVLLAVTPNWLIKGGLLTKGTIAHVAATKYARHFSDRLPRRDGDQPG
ncbi:MAG: hypothetical protein WAT09_02755 [Paracoccaceae bacterium]